ncbi:predicted protein [Histoplasma capsulatum G186AR]|uniref:MADS-box domain-containing protein n=2 Tax=Ajellomyces capsulatus TaxID=5037 RepID=C0NPV1_AJECG|nr:uncharacterized protein HCBG_05181 [Histoplasma capsulatum G186AR]EEH06961.1 predicted protein [Histoplasma capsulatum G186AR]
MTKVAKRLLKNGRNRDALPKRRRTIFRKLRKLAVDFNLNVFLLLSDPEGDTFCFKPDTSYPPQETLETVPKTTHTYDDFEMLVPSKDDVDNEGAKEMKSDQPSMFMPPAFAISQHVPYSPVESLGNSLQSCHHNE